jgi:predicted transcriptional regulator
MPKEAVFTMKLEPELRAAFMAAAAAADRPASQILREMMRDYIQQQRESREYEAFLRAKVTAARRSVESGRGHPNVDVEAEFSARRERALRSE